MLEKRGNNIKRGQLSDLGNGVVIKTGNGYGDNAQRTNNRLLLLYITDHNA